MKTLNFIKFWRNFELKKKNETRTTPNAFYFITSLSSTNRLNHKFKLSAFLIKSGMFVKSSAVKLEASCLGALSLRLLCHSSNTFTAHLVLCWVFLGTVLSKRRRSSSSVFGGRNRRTPLSSSMSTFATQMYHCKRLRQFKENIARKW